MRLVLPETSLPLHALGNDSRPLFAGRRASRHPEPLTQDSGDTLALMRESWWVLGGISARSTTPRDGLSLNAYHAGVRQEITPTLDRATAD